MALDRPVYSTPPPVESTPQNNECRLVDVHGHKIAAFTINHDEYICLPQVCTGKQGWCKGPVLAILGKALKFENFEFFSILGLIDNDLKRIYC